MKDRRLFSRTNVNIPVKFLESGANKKGTGKIINISAVGGGLIVTGEKLQPLSHLEMWLELPDNKEPFYTTGEVIWLNELEPNVYRIGVKFDKVDFMGIAQVLKIKDTHSNGTGPV